MTFHEGKRRIEYLKDKLRLVVLETIMKERKLGEGFEYCARFKLEHWGYETRTTTAPGEIIEDDDERVWIRTLVKDRNAWCWAAIPRDVAEKVLALNFLPRLRSQEEHLRSILGSFPGGVQ